MTDLDHTFTVKDVAREAIRLATEHPDAVYEGLYDGRCYYTRGEAAGAQGCLFGQALRNLGVEHLDQYDPSGEHWSPGIVGLLRDLGITASPHEDVCLVDAQSLQDDGHTWSEAVESLAAMMEGGADDA